MQEKRKHPRIKKKLKFEVFSEEGLIFSTTSDLSGGGIFITTPDPVKVGSEIRLALKLPGEEDIEIKGIVRWLNEGNLKIKETGMGIEFIGLTDEQKSIIKKITEQRYVKETGIGIQFIGLTDEQKNIIKNIIE